MSIRSVVLGLFLSVGAATALFAQSSVTADNFTDVTGVNVDAKTGDATTSAFRVFNSANAELLRVSASGMVAIGSAPVLPLPLSVYGAAYANGVSRTVLGVYDSSTYAANVGGGIAFGGKFLAAGTPLAQEFASIEGVKENNTEGDYAGALTFNTRVNQGLPTERMRINSNGWVGIGTTTPGGPLHLGGGATNDVAISLGGDVTNGPVFNLGYAGSSFGRSSAFFNVRPDVLAVAPNPSLRFLIANAQKMMVSGTGIVIGSVATVPTEQLEVTGGSMYVNGEDAGLIVDAGNNKRFGVIKNSGQNTELRYTSEIPFRIRRVTAGTLRFPTGSDTPMTISASGNVGIGLLNPNDAFRLDVAGAAHFSSSVVVDGNIAAKYQDVAEWVPSRDDLAPGTVVVLDPAAGNGVLASSTPYDTTVAGVVSAQPGIILGEAGQSKEQIATSGRVRVKVDASHGAIAVGDLLVTSDKPGFAMHSVPLDLGGVPIHRPGTILGKALEPLAGGEGEILVLLSLQ
ncbi:MAG: hypothetical protein ABI779_13795 [Acidobacteriota bacterium]